MTRYPSRMSNKVRSATDSMETHDVDDFDRGGYPGKKHVDMQEKSDPVALIAKFSELGEALRRTKSMSEVAEQISQIAETAEMTVSEDSGDWFDQHTIRRNMKELKKYSADFAKISEEMDTLHQRGTALYDDMGNVLSRYFEIAGDTRGNDDSDVERGQAVGFEPKQHLTQEAMSVPEKHQLKIARDTLRMSDEGAQIMGGMTKDEARAFLKKHGKKVREAIVEDRKADIYQARRALRTPKSLTRVANKMTRDDAIKTLNKLGAKNVAESYNKMLERLQRLAESRPMLQEAMDPMEKEQAIRQIVADKQYAKVDGQKVDLFSASAMVAVMDNLAPSNKKIFLQMPVRKMAIVAFKLVK